MNRQPRTPALVCLLGLLVSLILIVGLSVARERVLRQSSSAFYTPLTGEAEWEGDWELSESGADPSEAGSTARTDRVTIPFTGTHLALRVRRGGYRAYFWISVDGEPANWLPRTEQGAYLVLSSPDYEPQVTTIPIAGDLDAGRHVAVITADRGWDQWPLVGWRVSRRPDTTPYRRALTISGVLGLACLLGLIYLIGDGDRETKPLPGARVLQSPISDLCSPISNLQSPFPIPPLALLTAAGLFYLSRWPPLTVASLLALSALVFLRLDLGLALVALSIPFYVRPRPLLGKIFSMVEIATLLCAASWSVRGVVQWARSRRQETEDNASRLLHPASPLDVVALFFVLVAAVSTLFADYRHVALRELRVAVIEPALLYLMVRTARLDERAIWRIVDAFVIGAAAVALIGLAQYALDVNVITAEQGFRRLRSVYGSPNNAALYLGRALPILAAVALFDARGRRRIVYGALAVPVALATLLSFSRGAILLGMPLSLLALGVLAGGRWRWAALGVVVVAAITIIPLLSTPRFAGLLDPHSGTLFFRLQLWRASWMMVRDHPWLGVGPDNFLYHYRGRYILPSAWQEPHLSHAHNVLLGYATRLGILGLTAGMWLQIAFWRLALPLREAVDRGRRALALGMAGSMVYTLAHGMVDASTFFVDLAFAFFLTLSLVQWLHITTFDVQPLARKR